MVTREETKSRIEALETRLMLSGSTAAWLYGASVGGTLYRINPVSGALTTVGATGLSTLMDIGFGADGKLYGVDGDELYRIDQGSAGTALVGRLGLPEVNALAADKNGVLYGADTSGRVVRINSATGNASVIGSLGSNLVSWGDLAFSRKGILFGTVHLAPFSGSAPGYLASIDVSTGQATVIGKIGFDEVYGLEFGPDGLLYAAAHGGKNHPPSLIQINPATGAGTLLRDFASSNGMVGFAADPTAFRITGKVVDADGNPLHGVRVAIGTATLFTDYDGKKPVFDGLIDGDFSVLGTMGAGWIPVTVHAEDIAGNVFETSLNVNTATAPVDLGTITLKSDAAVDSNNLIHLHKDLANDENSHLIRRRKSSDAVGKSSRYRQEVRAITLKLASMGFRTDVNGTSTIPMESVWGSDLQDETPAERALKLFQVLSFVGKGAGGAFISSVGLGKVNGKVTGQVNAETVNAMNGIGGVIWTRNLPSFNNGFTYNTSDSTLVPWMNSTVAYVLGQVATKSVITDVTRGNGGQAPAHSGAPKSHNIGAEVDLRWISITGSGSTVPGNFFLPLSGLTTADVGSIPLASQEYTAADKLTMSERRAKVMGKTWTLNPTYSRENTKAFLKQLAAQGSNQIIFNDPVLVSDSELAGKVVALVGHNDHIHAGYPFNRRRVLPVGTDGAPAFSAQSVRGTVTTPLPLKPTYAKGAWYGDDGYVFTFTSLLSYATNGTAVDGVLNWTLKSTPTGSPLSNRIGNSAREFVRGTFDPVSRRLDLSGYMVDDESLLSTDVYRITVAADGKTLSGITRGNSGAYKSTIAASIIAGI